MKFKEKLIKSLHVLFRNKRRLFLSMFFISLNLSLYGYASYCISFNKSISVYNTIQEKDVSVLNFKKHKQIKSTDTTMHYETLIDDDLDYLSKEVGGFDVYGVPYSMISSVKTLPYQNGYQIKGEEPLKKQDVLISKTRLSKYKKDGFFDEKNRKYIYPSKVTEDCLIGSHIRLTKDNVGDMFVIKGIIDDDSIDENTYFISDSYYQEYKNGEGSYYLGSELSLNRQNPGFKINGKDELCSVGMVDSSHDITYFENISSLDSSQVLVSPELLITILKDKSDETTILKTTDSIDISFDEDDLQNAKDSGLVDQFSLSFKVYPEYFLDFDYLEEKILNIGMFNVSYILIDDCLNKYYSEFKENLNENEKEQVDTYLTQYRSGTEGEKMNAKGHLSLYLSNILKMNYLGKGKDDSSRFSIYDEESYSNFYEIYLKYKTKEMNLVKEWFTSLYESLSDKDLSFELSDYETTKTKQIVGIDYNLKGNSFVTSKSGIDKIINKVEYSSIVTLNNNKVKLKKITDINGKHNNKVITFFIFVYSNNNVGDYYILQDETSLSMNIIESNLIVVSKILLIIAILLTIYSIIASRDFMRKAIKETIADKEMKIENSESAIGIYNLVLIEYSLLIFVLSYLLVLFIGGVVTGIFNAMFNISICYLVSFLVPVLTVLVLTILFVYFSSLFKVIKFQQKKNF